MHSWSKGPELPHFPSAKCAPYTWLSSVSEELEQLESSIKRCKRLTLEDETYLIDDCLTKLRTPTIQELIEKEVLQQVKNVEEQFHQVETNDALENNREEIAPVIESQQIHDGFDFDDDSSIISRRIRKYSNRLLPFPIYSENIEWSERRLFIQHRQDTVLQTYKLSHDCDEYRFKRILVSYNFVPEAHRWITKLLETKSHNNTSIQIMDSYNTQKNSYNLLSSQSSPLNDIQTHLKKNCQSSIESRSQLGSETDTILKHPVVLNDSSNIHSVHKSSLKSAPQSHNTGIIDVTSHLSSILKNQQSIYLYWLIPIPLNLCLYPTNSEFSNHNKAIRGYPTHPMPCRKNGPGDIIYQLLQTKQLSCVVPPKVVNNVQSTVLHTNDRSNALVISPIHNAKFNKKFNLVKTSQSPSTSIDVLHTHNNDFLAPKNLLNQNGDKIPHSNTAAIVSLGLPKTHDKSSISLHQSQVIPYVSSQRNQLTTIEHDEIIVTISFYQSVRGLKSAEFDVLGSQTLAQLKDVFICDEDVSVFCYASARHCLASLFLIDGVFYIDGRRPGDSDISLRLAEHFRRHSPSKLRELHYRQFMEATTLGQLIIGFNERCAYYHRGDCEHRVMMTSMSHKMKKKFFLFVFRRNVRKHDPKFDSPYKEAYPVRVFEPASNVTLCQTCLLNGANKLVFNSSRLPQNGMHLCLRCYDLFFINHDGSCVTDEDFVHVDFQDPS